jgi:hypothetical protein
VALASLLLGDKRAFVKERAGPTRNYSIPSKEEEEEERV